MTDLQAALGLSQLERLDAIVDERNLQLNHYRKHLSDSNKVARGAKRREELRTPCGNPLRKLRSKTTSANFHGTKVS